MGGVWERQIRTVRRVLAGLTREQVLGKDELHTLLTTTDSIVNNSPITPVSADPNDLEALTPNHILLMKPAALVPLQTCEADQYHGNWKQVLYLAEVFWRRWTKEVLRARTRWPEPKSKVDAGDLRS